MIQQPGESGDAMDTQGDAPETLHMKDLYPDYESEVGVHSRYTLYYMACYTVNYMDQYIELHSSFMLTTLPIPSPAT